MSGRLTVLGFDADDTLWKNESFFRMSETRFAEMLDGYADPDHLAERLFETEKKNLGHYGFGIKGFILSMIETALDVTDQKVSGKIIGEIVSLGQEMLQHPIELLPHVEATLGRLADTYPLVLITKGDLLHQEQKLAASGLGDLFTSVEIVSDKVPTTYTQAFDAFGGAHYAMMVGNSMASDILPALDAGAFAVHVPHGVTWALDMADPPEGHAKFHALPDLGPLPDLISDVEARAV